MFNLVDVIYRVDDRDGNSRLLLYRILFSLVSKLDSMKDVVTEFLDHRCGDGNGMIDLDTKDRLSLPHAALPASVPSWGSPTMINSGMVVGMAVMEMGMGWPWRFRDGDSDDGGVGHGGVELDM